MWASRTKGDLAIEVWEKLDCESVGRPEIEAIRAAIEGEFGPAAVDSPMVIARLLADEGAELRHSEILELYVTLAQDRPYDAAFRNIVQIGNLEETAASIRNLESLRQNYLANNDPEGLRLVRAAGIRAKAELTARAEKKGGDAAFRLRSQESSHWFSVWLQTPAIFDSWLDLRRESPEFQEKFCTSS
ncbi:MAG: hypothetical protein WKF34_00950 [Pyrinomonadaceae bacterium]